MVNTLHNVNHGVAVQHATARKLRGLKGAVNMLAIAYGLLVVTAYWICGTTLIVAAGPTRACSDSRWAAGG